MATETLFCLMRVWPKEAGRAAERVLDDDGAPRLFASGEDAQDAAQAENYDLTYWLEQAMQRDNDAETYARHGDSHSARVYSGAAVESRRKAQEHEKRNGKVQPRPYATDSNWRDRERQRFSDGTYQALPWAEDSWWTSALAKRPSLVEHFAHVAKDAPGMLSYTESAQKGALDRQTRARPGRYLSAHFAEVLSADEIRAHAARYAATFEGLELRFSDSATSIERVYRRGPTSCMSHPPGDYQTPYHPVRIYGDSDLSVAFIGQGTVNSSEFHVSARALVWRERKVYGRIYGDSDRMAYLLELAGYKQGGTERDSEGRAKNPFPGARLPLRTLEGDPTRIIMPYVDGHSRALISDDGKWLTLADESAPPRGALDIHPGGSHETGIVKDSRPRCQRCRLVLGAERGVMVQARMGDALWCTACNTAHAVEAVDAPGMRFAPDAVTRCEGSGRYYYDRANLVMVVDSGERWSRVWAESHGYESPRGQWHAGARPAHVPPIPTALASVDGVSVGDLVRFMPGEDSTVASRIGYSTDRTYAVVSVSSDGYVRLPPPASRPDDGPVGFFAYRLYRVSRSGEAQRSVAA